jgi:hypothetical protein
MGDFVDLRTITVSLEQSRSHLKAVQNFQGTPKQSLYGTVPPTQAAHKQRGFVEEVGGMNLSMHPPLPN